MKNGVRIGAAAFVMGLQLAGPQGLGLAVAETGDVESSVSAGPAKPRGADAARASAEGIPASRGGRDHTGRARSVTPADSPGPKARRTAGRGATAEDVSPASSRERGSAGSAVPAPSGTANAAEDAALALPWVSPPAGRSVAPPGAVPDAQPTSALASPAAANYSDRRIRPRVAVSPTTPPSATAAQERVDVAVRQAFNAVQQRLLEMPAGPLSSFLEGALLMVRRSFFNQAPRVTPSSQTTSDADGTIGGRIGAFDLEGDALTYTVTGDPQRGTVTIDSDGVYTYTPNAQYAGADSFTVTLTPEKRSLNILNLASDGSRVVTIQIGNPTVYDNPDVAVKLSDTAGNITITKRGFNQFTGTVTLTNVTADTQALWVDTSGRLGRISLAALTDNYRDFQARAAESGATVDLTLAYTAADGTRNALLLNDVEMVVDPGGRYVFTGRLAPDPEIETTAVDVWDVVGKEYKPLFDNFRRTYNLKPSRTFTTVDVDFTGADFFADTITPLSYQQAGLYAQDSESRPKVDPAVPTAPATVLASPAPLTLAQAPGLVALSPVTAAISSGETVIVGRKDGSVELWTDGQKKKLQDAGWNTSVQTLLEYDLPLKDVEGNTILSTFNGYISGTTLTVTGLGPGSTVVVGSEITGAGVAAGTRITRFIDQSATCTDAACTQTTGTGAGGSNGYTGTYEVSVSQTVGSAIASPSPDDPGVRMPAGIVLTQKDVPAAATAFVVGLTNGAIELYSATHGWTELHPYEIGYGAVVSMITYREGIVVGFDNGAVRQWTGPGANADPNTWQDNWTELRGKDIQRGTGGAVTTLTPFDGPADACVGGCDGFLVGFVDGAVWQYSEAKNGGFNPGWQQRSDGGWNSAVKGIFEVGNGVFGPIFDVVLENGAVQEYVWQSAFAGQWRPVGQLGGTITALAQDGTDYFVGLANGAVLRRNVQPGPDPFTELQGTGWGSAVNRIVPFESATVGNGVLVGLANGSVQAWKGPGQGWVELHDSAWSSGVAALAPSPKTVINDYGQPVRQDGVIVGLDNGTVQRWSGIVSGTTAQDDWKELEGIKNLAESVLSRKEDWSCSDLRCSQPGALQDAVTFAKGLASGGKVTYGTPGGVGGPSDPIFGDPLLGAAGSGGTYKPIAFYKKLSPASYTAPAAIKFTASIDVYTGEDKCGTGTATCSVLKVPLSANPNINLFTLDANALYEFGFPSGSLLESDTLISGMQPGTTVAKDITVLFEDTAEQIYSPSRYFLLSGPPQTVSSSAMKVTTTPSVKVSLDTSPVAYGYVYVPDGFFPKSDVGNWSVGALVAAEIGPSLQVNLGSGGSLYAPVKDVPVFGISTPGPLGADSFQLNTGVKVGANVTVNGLPNTTSASAYAYAVPGMLVTYNTAGAPDRMQAAFNYYLDVNANAFKDLSGVSVTGTVTPYVNLLYGMAVPKSVPLVGGWSLFSISGGFENPLSATVCADANRSCPAGGTGSGVANFYGVINDGTFANKSGKTYATAGAGNILTVTQSALFNPTKLAVGQLLTGPGVLAGTTITKYLGSTEFGTQYEVSTPQKSVGGGAWGTHPSLTAYLPGSPVSLTVGSQGLLTFHAGAMEALTSKLSYDAKVPLYEVNYVIAPEPAAPSLV